MLSLTGSLFTACLEEEFNSEELIVYLRNVTGDPISATYERTVYVSDSYVMEGSNGIEHQYQVCTSRNLVTSADITVSANSSDVETYNQTHGTSYVLLPQGAYTLSAQELTLQEGEMQSPIGIVKITDLAALDLSKNYLLPLTITSVSSKDKGLQISKNRNTVYLLFRFELTYFDPEAEMVEGDLIDRSGWEISATGYFQQYSPDLAFDGDLKTAYINDGAVGGDYLNARITVDMTRTEEIAGFRIYPNNTLFGQDVNGKVMRFEISEDGQKWTNLGTSSEIALNEWWDFSDPIYTYVKLFKPQSARYIRFSWTDSYNPAMIFISVGEIDVVK